MQAASPSSDVHRGEQDSRMGLQDCHSFPTAHSLGQGHAPKALTSPVITSFVPRAEAAEMSPLPRGCPRPAMMCSLFPPRSCPVLLHCSLCCVSVVWCTSPAGFVACLSQNSSQDYKLGAVLMTTGLQGTYKLLVEGRSRKKRRQKEVEERTRGASSHGWWAGGEKEEGKTRRK